MLTRTTSPIRDQQFIGANSASSNIVFPPGFVRKLPGTSGTSVRHERCEQANCLLPADNKVRLGPADGEPQNLVTATPTLLGMAAHDLRQPATALLIASELLAESAGPSASQEILELVESIHSVSKFFLSLLDDTLELAENLSGTVQLHTVPSTVAPIAARSVAMACQLAAKKQMRLSLFEEGQPTLVLLDPIKMSKVFNNLIENAIKYCPRGTRIDVNISRSQDGVLVSVHDNGPGIDPADLKVLFTPFQRTRSRARSDEPSTGLGLAIAKHAVELHGGQIWVTSELGKGTVFYVSLPKAIPEAAKAVQASKKS